jgi:hypothetical protein
MFVQNNNHLAAFAYVKRCFEQNDFENAASVIQRYERALRPSVLDDQDPFLHGDPHFVDTMPPFLLESPYNQNSDPSALTPQLVAKMASFTIFMERLVHNSSVPTALLPMATLVQVNLVVYVTAPASDFASRPFFSKTFWITKPTTRTFAFFVHMAQRLLRTQSCLFHAVLDTNRAPVPVSESDSLSSFAPLDYTVVIHASPHLLSQPGPAPASPSPPPVFVTGHLLYHSPVLQHDFYAPDEAAAEAEFVVKYILFHRNNQITVPAKIVFRSVFDRIHITFPGSSSSLSV